jgi:hypothetical protein
VYLLREHWILGVGRSVQPLTWIQPSCKNGKATGEIGRKPEETWGRLHICELLDRKL